MEFSLMYPEGYERNNQTLTAEAINDLSINFILEALSEKKYERDHLRKLMTNINADPEVIKYRVDVFEDFLKYPELREAMEELVVKLADLRDLERFQKDQEGSALWSLINRLREIDDYVSCINMIKSTLERLPIRSTGMLRLRQIVTDIALESGFDELKADIDETMRKARTLRSITIGVNLDNVLRPKTAGIVSLNDTEFTDSGLMRRFMNFTDKKDDLHFGTDVTSLRKFHPANPSTVNLKFGSIQQRDVYEMHIETNSLTGEDTLSNAIAKPVTDIMKRTVSDIKSTLKRYVNISGYALTALMPEIIFFVRWAALIDRIKGVGMPVCKATILPCAERKAVFGDIYNLKLAINKINGEDIDIVKNDVSFDDDHRIFILTGPNRGGKTIFTQAVGLAMAMASWGVYLPARTAAISPCDNVYTHFPADENDTVDLGRLGEESMRLASIFKTATCNSLLLLNESLATTSVAEGLFIAKDVVKAMRYLGCRAVFNTHMHDLARSGDELNAEVEGESRIESLVTGVSAGRRSFKVAILPPQGVSYAKDIAVKYGVTYDRIKAGIGTRNKQNEPKT